MFLWGAGGGGGWGGGGGGGGRGGGGGGGGGGGYHIHKLSMKLYQNTSWELFGDTNNQFFKFKFNLSV
jgi:hypothetical protein